MATQINKGNELPRLRNYTWTAAIFWTLTLAALLSLNLLHLKQTTHDLAVREAEANFNKDQAFRHWASRHGGVYVPITLQTQPNPYLTHVSERDISTPSGKKLTLMNPAYLIRQLNEQFDSLYGIKGHITSLNVLRPGNEPDNWESKALESFEQGHQQLMEITEIEGHPYLRLMRPMIVKPHCLKCHATQGYKVGDVRGGVSISVPLRAHLERQQQAMLFETLSYGGVWIIGLLAIIGGGRGLINAERRRQRNEHELWRINGELQQFAEVTAHQLKQPLALISTQSRQLQQQCRIKADSDTLELMDQMSNESKLLQQIIDNLLTYASLKRSSATAPPTDSRIVVGHLLEKRREDIDAAAAEVILGSLPLIPMEEEHLQLLLERLIDNALRYHGDAIPRIEIAADREGSRYHFTVSDNGIGIDPTVQQTLFKLSSGKTATKDNHGIGLALCHKLVTLYGGTIWVDSRAGKGCTVHFTLPTERG